jgi:hypothetical protein
MMLDLSNETDDVLSKRTPRHKIPWLLVATVALGTVLIVVVIAWAAGVVTITPSSQNDTAADDVVTVESLEKRIKGNRRTRIYHLPRCQSFNSISPRNVRWFNTEENAIAAKYRRADNC